VGFAFLFGFGGAFLGVHHAKRAVGQKGYTKCKIYLHFVTLF
jgi:hypothetical protein